MMIFCFIVLVIMRSGGWYYKDRLGRTRGPLELITLKTAWGAGIIDKDTFIWGEDMDEWAPIHMVYGLEPAIATWEGLFYGVSSYSSFSKSAKGVLLPMDVLEICGHGHRKKKLTYRVTIARSAMCMISALMYSCLLFIILWLEYCNLCLK